MDDTDIYNKLSNECIAYIKANADATAINSVMFHTTRFLLQQIATLTKEIKSIKDIKNDNKL